MLLELFWGRLAEIDSTWGAESDMAVRRLLLCVMVVASVAASQHYEWDEHGYVLYCPCMGMRAV